MQTKKYFAASKATSILTLLAILLTTLALRNYASGQVLFAAQHKKVYLKEQVISRITKKLHGRTWKYKKVFKKSTANVDLTFNKVEIDTVRFHPQSQKIYLRCIFHCVAKIPTQLEPFTWGFLEECRLSATQLDPAYRGSVNLPGYGRVYISIPSIESQP